MGVELLKIGNKMRRGVIFTIRGCFRSICNHPFLVVIFCSWIYMYRSSPFMFSLLVSAFPVLICTAILLGTLLSFGETNIPEIEIEDKTTYEAPPLNTGLSRDDVVVEQNDSHYFDRYSEKSRYDSEQSDEELSWSASSKLGEIRLKGSSNDSAPFMKESPRVGKSEIREANGELDDKIDEQKSEWGEEILSDGEVIMKNDEPVELDDEKSVADSFDSERVNVDDEEGVEEEEVEEEEEEEEDDALDSGSDGAESSSPDASMTDIMPMLDELHPLLDEEAAQLIQMSRHTSDAESEPSIETSISSSSSDSLDDIQNHDDSDVAEDENEDDEDAEADKEEQTKSAITWTEEDQKNLMDLGSSEIERNQRLENLILRRRTRKYTSMVPEINLIDFESSDFPLHIAPISTTRQNPFDLPQDSFSGLPPIPGSAPSILQPRCNPFDIPYDYISEEKHVLTGDGFREEVTTTSQSREPFFRRHESFSVGPSVFAPSNRQEKHDIRLRPYFVPERMISEESSYSSFHRQSSEMSDSKVSSVPETESVGSVEDMEYEKLAEEDNPHEIEVISKMEEVIEECPSGDHELVPSRELSEEDVPREPELISEMEHISVHIGHGSHSSGEEDEEEESLDVDSCSEVVEPRYSRDSSSSSFSEVSDRRDGIAEKPDISTKTAIRSTDLSISNALAEDVPHKEPVYDLSPPAGRKAISSSSSSSDGHAESDLRSPHVLVKRTVSFIEKESENQVIEKDNSSNVKMLSEPSTIHPADENESARVDISVNSGSSGVGASAEENVMDKHTQGEVACSASDIHTAVDDKNLGKSEEDKRLLISERDGLVRVRTSEGQLKEHNSVDKQETVLSPDSDVDYQEANEKLIPTPTAGRSTPSAGGTTSHFYDRRMHEPDYEHLDEVQVPNTPVESFEHVRTIQNLNIPEVLELDQGIAPNINSPYSPDFISMPSSSSSSEEANSRVDMETILEDDDEIKEIDGLLSELDSVGDFSITSGSNEFEKHIDTVGERFSSAHHDGSSASAIMNSAEVNEAEHATHLGNPSDAIDIHEEEIKSISEPQTSQASHKELDERDGPNSTNQITSKEETVSKENETEHSNSTLHRSYEDTISQIPEVEMQSTDDLGSLSEESELASTQTKVMVESAEVSHHDPVDINTVPEMPELEDIHVVKQSSEIENPVVTEPPQAELVIGETIDDLSKHVNASVIDSTHETPNLEVRSIEDTTLDYNQVNNGSTENHGKIHVVDTEETQGTSESHASSPPTKLLDGNSEKELKPNMNDESVEVKEEKLDSSLVEDSSVKEASDIATQKPDNDVKAHQDTHSAESVKEKRKISKKSSSSSSSSSSDSD